MSVEVINFGCRLNLAEGATLERTLAAKNDMIVVNACAVTAEAARQARQAIRRAAGRRPAARIVVTGCGAATDAGRYSAMPEVSAVIDKHDLLGRAIPVSGSGHARAFIGVQDGCDHDCTFCVTTHARGASRSQPVDAVVAAVGAAVDRGHREVVLTGVDLTGFRPSLAALITAILRGVPELARLRLSSVDPADVDEELLAVLAHEPRVMPHLHLSLQSGDPLILKRMKRRHDPDQAIALVERLRSLRPELAVGADCIAGFPTESAAAHANSRAVMAACGVVFAHVFPYSPRPGTAAARMPQTPPAIARERAAELRADADVRRAAWLSSMVGSAQSVLVELDGRSGHAANFASVLLVEAKEPGRIAAVTITGGDGDRLQGVGA